MKPYKIAAIIAAVVIVGIIIGIVTNFMVRRVSYTPPLPSTPAVVKEKPVEAAPAVVVMPKPQEPERVPQPVEEPVIEEPVVEEPVLPEPTPEISVEPVVQTIPAPAKPVETASPGPVVAAGTVPVSTGMLPPFTPIASKTGPVPGQTQASSSPGGSTDTGATPPATQPPSEDITGFVPQSNFSGPPAAQNAPKLPPFKPVSSKTGPGVTE
jgi:hypothetical protein